MADFEKHVEPMEIDVRKTLIEDLREHIKQYEVEIDILKSQNKVLKEDLKDREERINKLDINYNHLKENYDTLNQNHEDILKSKHILRNTLTYVVGLL